MLYREIRETKQKIEQLKIEFEDTSNVLSKLRNENSELVRASREALETRDQFRQSMLELDRCRVEMRHVEEEMTSLQIHRGIEADKLIAMVHLSPLPVSPPLLPLRLTSL